MGGILVRDLKSAIADALCVVISSRETARASSGGVRSIMVGEVEVLWLRGYYEVSWGDGKFSSTPPLGAIVASSARTLLTGRPRSELSKDLVIRDVLAWSKGVCASVRYRP